MKDIPQKNNLNQFIKDVIAQLPQCLYCNQPMSNYCLETTCKTKYFCIQCSSELQNNLHFLHQSITFDQQNLYGLQTQLEEAKFVYRQIAMNIDSIENRRASIVDNYKWKIEILQQMRQKLQKQSKKAWERCQYLEKNIQKINELMNNIFPSESGVTNNMNDKIQYLAMAKLKSYEQIKFCESIRENMSAIISEQSQFEFNGYSLIEKFIKKQRQTKNTNNNIYTYIDFYSYNNEIRISIKQSHVNAFLKEIKSNIDVKLPSENQPLQIRFNTKYEKKLLKYIYKCAFKQKVRIKYVNKQSSTFVEQERNFKNKMFQIYKLHRSGLSRLKGSIKSQIVQFINQIQSN